VTGDLHAAITTRTARGALVRSRPDGRLECLACAHRCALSEGARGVCGVRLRRGDALEVPFGYVAARRIRPVETNTIYHVLPGALAMIVGMYGCDLRCPYCHNWRLSQALRDDTGPPAPEAVTAAGLADLAVGAGCRVVAAAYNEPMIAAEWLHAVFTEARARGLVTAVISDGHTTREALAYLRPVTDVYRIDLKGFTEEQYRALGGRLAPVLDAIVTARALGFWVEVVTLVVPAFNDDLAGLRRIAAALAAIDPGMPWHLNAFHPRHRWRDRPRQGGGLLVSAAGAAYARGLRHVYVGNLADSVRELAHTRCGDCRAVVVERCDYRTVRVDLRDGACPACGARVPGLWTAPAPDVSAAA
jgi:pyruvate formate lyase activating enzyme